MKTYAEGAAENFTSTMFLFVGDEEPLSRAKVHEILTEWGWQLTHHEKLAKLGGVEWAEGWETNERIFIVSLMRIDESLLELICFDEARVEDEGLKKEARKAKWLLRVETQWDPHYPIDSFRQQIQFCAPFCLSRKMPLFDFNSTHLFSYEEVYELAFGKVPPRATNLYVIHDLYPSEGPNHDGHWLHTHGLNRAGLVDLELLNVPARYTSAAAELLIAAVDLLLGGNPPLLNKTIQVGHGLKVSLLEWEKYVSQLPVETVGGIQNRLKESGSEDPFHAGYRTAIVSQKPKGFFKKKWNLPVGVLSDIAKNGDDIIWKSTAEIERLKMLANDRWEVFCRLYQQKKDDWKFSLKLGCPIDSSGTRNEYLWFEVYELEKDRVRAVLKNQSFGSRKFNTGVERWYPLNIIADWKIHTPTGNYSPEDAHILLDGGSAAKLKLVAEPLAQ